MSNFPYIIIGIFIVALLLFGINTINSKHNKPLQPEIIVKYKSTNDIGLDQLNKKLLDTDRKLIILMSVQDELVRDIFTMKRKIEFNSSYIQKSDK